MSKICHTVLHWSNSSEFIFSASYEYDPSSMHSAHCAYYMTDAPILKTHENWQKNSSQEAERNCLNYTRLHLIKIWKLSGVVPDLLFHCTKGEYISLFKSIHTFPPYFLIKIAFKLIATLVLSKIADERNGGSTSSPSLVKNQVKGYAFAREENLREHSVWSTANNLAETLILRRRVYLYSRAEKFTSKEWNFIKKETGKFFTNQ